MKIAIISTMEASPWGGSEELWALVAREALAAGHEVAVFVRRWGIVPAPLRELRERGARVFRRGRSLRLPAERLARRVLGRSVRLAGPASPFRALARFRPDVVLLSEGALYSYIHVQDVADWLARTRTPYVTLCHLVTESYVAPDDRRERAAAFYGRAARAAFVSAANLRMAERQLAAALPNGVVVRNPINPSAADAGAPPASGPAVLASVARLAVAHKGQDLLLQALSDPAWRARDWRLDLYGSGPDEAYLRALAEMYGLRDRVRFLGHVHDVGAVWSASHLLVMPSRQEGTPLALVEAMLCGRPAVVTDVGGNLEWVAEGETGFVAEAPSARSVGAALERAWAARARWPDMGARAREAARAQYDPETGHAVLDLLLHAARAAASP